MIGAHAWVEALHPAVQVVVGLAALLMPVVLVAVRGWTALAVERERTRRLSRVIAAVRGDQRSAVLRAQATVEASYSRSRSKVPFRGL